MKKKFVFVLLILLFVLTACIPSQQQVVEILSAVEQTAAAQVTLVAPTADVDAIVQATFQALTAQAALTPQPSAGDTGSISGSLSYPSEGIPPQLVVAFNVDTGLYYWVLTEQNQATYQIDNLPVGTYNVIAYLLPDGSLVGTYDQVYLCGLQQGCDDYTLVDVAVHAGSVTPNINPGNWYGNAKNYPEIPAIAGGQQAPVFIKPISQSNGSIAGQLSYPSEFIPAQTVVAFATDGPSYYYVITAEGQSTYQIDNLPAGNYHVVSYLSDGSLSAGYSQAVLCGLSAECTDYNLVSVPVTGGQVAVGINPQDWYAPAGSFPAYPLP